MFQRKSRRFRHRSNSRGHQSRRNGHTQTLLRSNSFSNGQGRNNHRPQQSVEKLYEKYDHPLYIRLGNLAKKMGGHGGMDFIMRYRIIECLREGLPLDQNVYEGCFWSAVGPLSGKSVKEDGSAQKFPDFTRGNWKSTNPLSIIS